MAKTLEEKIEERKQQAQKRNIIEKAGAVAERVGTPVKRDYAEDATERGHCYESGLLKVSKLQIIAFPTHSFSGREFNSVSVVYNGKVRFRSEDSEITSYIPGRWERELNKLYQKFSVQTKQTEDDYSKREQCEKATKFGL